MNCRKVSYGQNIWLLKKQQKKTFFKKAAALNFITKDSSYKPISYSKRTTPRTSKQ